MAASSAHRFTLGAYLFDHVVFESDAFRIVLLEPHFRGIHSSENLDVVLVADLLGGVDVYEDGHWSLCRLVARDLGRTVWHHSVIPLN
ncbi:hypothetical protein AOQ71_10995 [Bradyrhizobium manausense]|uniref:Uncharacterized protein n=1 Tax=Bradyrhizobium manausense TaxID=989370 RepID=A0A0R3DYA7_9BRAD|nr:hypothetical protein AOQ71_10995 [Bradyrhizobium manausense]